MDLLARIDQDLRDAMKQTDTLKVSVLRMLKSAINYRAIDKRSPLNAEEIIQAIDKEVKIRKEAIAAYQGKRPELEAKERQELAILQTYLPASLPDVQIEQIITEVLVQAEVPANPGQLMGQVMARLKGQRVDGNRVQELVNSKIYTNG